MGREAKDTCDFLRDNPISPTGLERDNSIPPLATHWNVDIHTEVPIPPLSSQLSILPLTPTVSMAMGERQ